MTIHSSSAFLRIRDLYSRIIANPRSLILIKIHWILVQLKNADPFHFLSGSKILFFSLEKITNRKNFCGLIFSNNEKNHNKSPHYRESADLDPQSTLLRSTLCMFSGAVLFRCAVWFRTNANLPIWIHIIANSRIVTLVKLQLICNMDVLHLVYCTSASIAGHIVSLS